MDYLIRSSGRWGCAYVVYSPGVGPKGQKKKKEEEERERERDYSLPKLSVHLALHYNLLIFLLTSLLCLNRDFCTSMNILQMLIRGLTFRQL